MDASTLKSVKRHISKAQLLITKALDERGNNLPPNRDTDLYAVQGSLFEWLSTVNKSLNDVQELLIDVEDFLNEEKQLCTR